MTLRAELASKPLPKDWLVANFVSDSVGRIAIGGSSRGLSNEIDRASLLAYRDRAELVLTTAKTARAEQYRSVRDKALALVSRSGNFDEIPAVQEGSDLVFLVTTRRASKAVAAKYQRDGLFVIGLLKFSARGVRRSLKIRGFRKIVMEAGPTFTNWMASGRALSELALSITGLSRNFDKADANAFLAQLPAAKMQLRSVKQIEDTALTTWSVSAKTK